MRRAVVPPSSAGGVSIWVRLLVAAAVLGGPLGFAPGAGGRGGTSPR